MIVFKTVACSATVLLVGAVTTMIFAPMRRGFSLAQAWLVLTAGQPPDE